MICICNEIDAMNFSRFLYNNQIKMHLDSVLIFLILKYYVNHDNSYVIITNDLF